MRDVRTSVRRRFRSVYGPALGGTAACFALACGGEGASESALQLSQSDLRAKPLAPASNLSCDELLTSFKSNLRAQADALAEQARLNPYLPTPVSDPVPAFGAPTPAARSAAAPGSPAQQPGSSGADFSSTTQLVPGVDPADLIKGDGDRIYLVVDRTLLVVDASGLNVLASVPLGEDSPSELLVHEGKVLVFSIAYDVGPSSTGPLDPFVFAPYFTKLTLVDATTAEPTIIRESYFEGSYYSAGRAGSVVRSVIQQPSVVALDYPPVSYLDIFGVPRDQEDIDRQVDLWLELTSASIDESTIDDYLPEQYERVDGELQRVAVDCSGLVLPADGQGVFGRTVLVSLDLATPAAPSVAVPLFGSGVAASLSANAVVVAQQDYGDPLAFPPEPQSILHAFELDGTDSSYAGSISVPGYLTGTIGIDESRGVISAVFSRDIYGAQGYERSAAQLYTFGVQSGGLSALGQSPDLPGEYAQGLRFDGAQGYISSYYTAGSQLTVVDLSDPSAPALGGSLEWGGSSVLAPFGTDQLVTVTQTYDPVTFASDFVLSVLDVADPAAPAVAAELSLGQDSYSEAAYDLRAIGIHPDENLLSLPVENYLAGTSSLDVFELSAAGLTRLGGVTHQRPELTLNECLALLGFSTDPEFVATLDEELLALITQECTFYRLGTARRGLFRGDELFALSSVALTAHTLDALDELPLSRVDLPLPVIYPAPSPAAPVPIDVVIAPAPVE